MTQEREQTGQREPNSVRISRLLSEASAGRVSHEELYERVYAHLHELASGLMRRERVDHSLQPTVLVHEAWVRLGAGKDIDWHDGAHFFGAAGEAMRRILVDHARARGCAKREGGRRRLPVDALDLVQHDDPAEVLAVDDALGKLERLDKRLAQVVRLRFWAGLEEREVAQLLQLTERTVRRDWKLARAWLSRELEQ